ncbi:MAG: hypothetical protein IBV52_10085 [Candidatus Bathyarchaeota archaeon]
MSIVGHIPLANWRTSSTSSIHAKYRNVNTIFKVLGYGESWQGAGIRMLEAGRKL